MPKRTTEHLSSSKNFLLKKISSLKNLLFSFFTGSRTRKDTNYRIYADEDVGIIGKFDISEDQMMGSFNKFLAKTTQDVMIPRSDIVAIKDDVTIDELNKFIIKHGHTRTLIYKGNLDNIIGFVHTKDLFKMVVESKKYALKKLMRKHIISPQSMKLLDLLTQMKIHRTHIAVVVDEYGGTDGVVTIEDIVEEIVGPIDDEHDEAVALESYKIIKPGLVIASARVEIEELENVLSVKLKEDNDEFDTIGGLVMAKTGNVPEKGAVININEDVTIEILDSTPKTLKQLKIICNVKNLPAGTES